MAPTPRNELYTDVPIDATGTLTDPDGEQVDLMATGKREVALHIEATAAASFAVEVGVRHGDTVRWFGADRAYGSTDSVTDQWHLAEQRVRVTVETAADAGATADVYLAAV